MTILLSLFSPTIDGSIICDGLNFFSFHISGKLYVCGKGWFVLQIKYFFLFLSSELSILKSKINNKYELGSITLLYWKVCDKKIKQK